MSPSGDSQALVLIWAPHLIVGFFGGAALAHIALRWPKGPRRKQYSWHLPWLQGLTVLASVASFWGCASLVSRLQAVGSISSGWLYLDSLGLWFSLIVAAVGLAAALHSIGYHRFLKGLEKHSGKHAKVSVRFYMLFNFFLFSMLAVQLLDNLVLICMAVEVTTVISAFLVCHERRENPSSLEAAWKYMILASVGIVFAFLGTLLLFHAFIDLGNQSSDMLNLSRLTLLGVSDASQGLVKTDFLKLAFLFALLGYGTKAGLAPLHTWLPDAHGEAPAAVSALLSGVLLKSALYALLRFYELTQRFMVPTEAVFASQILLGAGLLSLVMAVPFIIQHHQKKTGQGEEVNQQKGAEHQVVEVDDQEAKHHRFKRILAYHSLEHMGIIVFAIGLGTPAGVFAALLHALYHALNKALMFLAHGALRLEQQRQGRSGLSWIKISPNYALMLAVAAVALVGSPPFAIFTSKAMIIRATLGEVGSRPWLGLALLLFVLSLVLIYAGLVRHVSDRLFDSGGSGRGNERETGEIGAKRVTHYWSMRLPVAGLAALIFLFGLGVPEPMAALVRAAVGCVLPGGMP